MDAQQMSESSENPKVPRRLAAILAADIAGYSALMGADEARTVRDLKEHQAVVLPMIKETAVVSLTPPATVSWRSLAAS
jgi:class 3 adenylate cyclase